MTQRSERLCHLAVLSLTGFLLLAPADAVARESCVSASCHASVLSGRNVHAATESCDACHEAVASPHPQRGAKTFKLAQDPPGLCSACHEAYGTKAHVHPPVQEGACTTCHNPHASDQPKLLAQPMKDLCVSCHEDPAASKVVHGPVSAGDCTACHSPHESDAARLLVKPGDDLCLGCHLDVKELMGRKHVHSALEGGCTSCHSPHGAEHPKLLAAAGAQACFQCHDGIGEKMAKSPQVHAPLKTAAACASCHSPHASDNESLLVKQERETCLGCHGAVLTQSMTFLHGPINEGRCTACHDPHGGPNTSLLVKGFPEDRYAPYTEQAYELCFGCHKRDLLEHPDTSFATGFRDGERNLHYLHVNNPRKGRSCTLCHEAHGSGHPRLIAESVPFGKWKLPIKYVKSETGGGCTPGCHRTAVYDREVPGRKPEAPRSSGGTD